MKRLAIFGTAVFLAILPVSLAIAYASFGRVSDNVPVSSVSGRGWHRAVMGDAARERFIVCGGGALGAGSWETECWEYDVNTDTWSDPNATDLSIGERFGNGSFGGGDNYGGMVSDSVAGCDTYIYNFAADTIATAVDPPATCGTGTLGTAAGDLFYMFTPGTGDVLDMSNPAGGWTSVANAPSGAPHTSMQYGQAVHDPNGGTGGYIVAMYSNGYPAIYDIALDTWYAVTTQIPGNTVRPWFGWYDVENQNTRWFEVQASTNSVNVYALVYDTSALASSTWSLVDTLTHVDIDYENDGDIEPGFAFTGDFYINPDGVSQILFGSGRSVFATPTEANPPYWWSYVGDEAAAVPSSNVDEWIFVFMCDFLGMCSEVGYTIFGFVTLMVLILAMMRFGIPPMITFAFAGFTMGMFTLALILPAAYFLTAFAVIGVSTMLGFTILRSRGGGDIE